MRILITGGCGFLGSHLVEHFLKTTEHEIVILDKLTYASSGFDRLRDIRYENVVGTAVDHPRIKVIGCDLAYPIPEGVRREVGYIDYVIHAAAETHVDNSIVDPLPFIQSNVLGTHHLLWWLQAERLAGPMKPRRIFLVSTDEVYGPAAWDSKGNVETDPFRPANPYAAAKAGGEAIGMAYANTYKLPITIVNTMNLYGERQHHEKFIPLVIRRALLGEKVLIHADPSKTKSGTRFYIHCRNYASALAWLIERDRTANEQWRGSTIPHALGSVEWLPIKLHVSGEREISNLDLAQMIASYVGKPLHYELVDFHSSRPGHDLRYALDDSKIREMGWTQPVNIEASLKKTVEWYLADGNRRWLGL
jgi:dTDP-glucose 4,6-dehydratase